MKETDSILSLKGIGDKTAKLFHRLDLFTLEELLSFYPRDYDCFEQPVCIADAAAGEVTALCVSSSGSVATKRIRNLTLSTVTVRDGTGTVLLTFFNMPYLKSMLSASDTYVIRGILTDKNGRKSMEQPKIYKPEDYGRLLNALQPQYPLTKGLTNHMVTKAVRQTMEGLNELRDYLPEDIRTKYHLKQYWESVKAIHFPEGRDQMEAARRRLVFDEFFLFLLTIRKLKDYAVKLKNENPMVETADTARLLEQLPYSLTGAQNRVWDEIKQDMTQDTVMNRLIQGDVGSGKTILAFLALLLCVSNGYQGALMAPTEVLAVQHMEAIRDLVDKNHNAFRPILLTGSMTAKEKRDAYERIEMGMVNVIIGTHALIQERVKYRNLALVITDEQHRFGVRQREALAGKGNQVHVLVMSATPIPRTLAIILYGDLQISVLDELPADRRPIRNCVVNTAYRPTAYRFMEKEIAAGRQAYVICPMVEEGEAEGLENVLEYTEKLKAVFPPEIQVACLHGKMRPALKNSILDGFANHHIDVLVSTTVIEVGINVPNATVMMIENAERFGLAQLHQLRGRVGRGREQSYCIFVSANENKQTMERLEILNRSNDGFLIASEDLKRRGPGDLFGIRQSGILDFKIGDIYQDASVLKDAGELVDLVLREDENLSMPVHEPIRRAWDKKRISIDFRTI